MVKFFDQGYNYEYSWPTVTLAYFMRYPNPYATHVHSADVIERYVDSDGRLHTTRILVKRGKIPAWSVKFLGNIGETFIVERSCVDRKQQLMQTTTRNLDHTKIMMVEENQLYEGDERGTTSVRTQARILSQFGFGLTSQIERFGLAKFREHISKVRHSPTSDSC